jgi:hypothetical protein
VTFLCLIRFPLAVGAAQKGGAGLKRGDGTFDGGVFSCGGGGSNSRRPDYQAVNHRRLMFLIEIKAPFGLRNGDHLT